MDACTMLAMPRRPDEWVEVFEGGGGEGGGEQRRTGVTIPARDKPGERRELRPRETSTVDFASVPPSQWKIHDRLENWARWSRGASGENARIKFTSPMFSLYRSSDVQRRRYGGEISVPIDPSDALKIHFAILQPAFDPQARRALQWCYLNGRNPTAAARELGVELQRLAELVREGRALLINRGV